MGCANVRGERIAVHQLPFKSGWNKGEQLLDSRLEILEILPHLVCASFRRPAFDRAVVGMYEDYIVFLPCTLFLIYVCVLFKENVETYNAVGHEVATWSHPCGHFWMVDKGM